MDKEIISKQSKLKEYDDHLAELNEIWKRMITKIDSFEQQCLHIKPNLEENKERIKKIEEILSNKEIVDLLSIDETIENEEITLMQNLFQNRTIVFLNVKGMNPSDKGLLDGKLLIINDETIRIKAFEKKYSFYCFK